MKRSVYQVFWLMIIIANSCSSNREGQVNHRFREYREDDVIVAETIGGPKHEGELFTYTVERIIDPEQNEEATLFRPTQFLADEYGNLFIMDNGIGSILMYNAEGEFLRSISQKGQGPGENRFGQIVLIHQDIIQLFDQGQQRTNRFSIVGELVDVTRLPIDSIVAPAIGLMVMPDNSCLTFVVDMKLPEMETQRRGVIVTSALGDILSSMFTPFIQVMKQVTVTRGTSTRQSPMPLLYGSTPIAIYHPTHGIVLSSGYTPELSIYNQSGEMTRQIRLDLPLESVTDADKAYAVQILMEPSSDEGEVTREMERMFRELPYAEQKAYWSEVEVDDMGYFWLHLNLTPLATLGATHRYRFLSPDGEYLGLTTRPAGSRSISSNGSISKGRLLVLEEDKESGEILPVIYKIIPAVRGFKYPN